MSMVRSEIWLLWHNDDVVGVYESELIANLAMSRLMSGKDERWESITRRRWTANNTRFARVEIEPRQILNETDFRTEECS